MICLKCRKEFKTPQELKAHGKECGRVDTVIQSSPKPVDTPVERPKVEPEQNRFNGMFSDKGQTEKTQAQKPAETTTTEAPKRPGRPKKAAD